MLLIFDDYSTLVQASSVTYRQASLQRADPHSTALVYRGTGWHRKMMKALSVIKNKIMGIGAVLTKTYDRNGLFFTHSSSLAM